MFLSVSLTFEILLLESDASYVLRFAYKKQKISMLIGMFLSCSHCSLRTWIKKTSQSRLSINLIELQPRAALTAHHYTEAAFQSILHCYHMCELLTQSGCTQCHRKSDRHVLGIYCTALSFRGQGLSMEGSYSLFHAGKNMMQFKLLKEMRYS